MNRTFFLLLMVGSALMAAAQPSLPAGAAASVAAPGSFPDLSGIVQSLSGTIPNVDPGTEVISWNGKNWAITNNRLFESQFEKYLSTPPFETLQNRTYRSTLETINRLLSGYPLPPQNLDEAFRLLTNLASFPQDGNISDVMANQIYMVWMAQRNTDRLTKGNQVLQSERKRLEWNLHIASTPNALDRLPQPGGAKAGISGGSAQIPSMPSGASAEQATKVQPIAARLAEVEFLLKSNQAKGEVTLARARTDFVTLLTQLFVQRRFDHLAIGIKFYRNIFNDGTSQVKLGDEAMNLFSKTSGNPPTLASLDAMGREMANNARQGAQAFAFMMDAGQVQSASKRLAEAFIIGEHLSEIAQVDLNKKQTVLAFNQKAHQLLSAIEVKNYGLAETLARELTALAKDLDTSKADAAVSAAKMASEMHLAKARNAAVSGDRKTLEAELQAAAEVWPSNPQLKEVASMIFAQADVQARAISDFDQLLSQKNYRQIYDDKMRFIAATAMLPDRREQLRKVLEDMQTIEAASLRAEEIAKRGDHAGAWESIEAVFVSFPDDNKLNQLRANLTTQTPDFVNALKRAKTLEANSQTGSALTAYLEAKKIYPPSQLASDGIIRLTQIIMPDSQ